MPLIKYNPPSRYDEEPFGQIWLVNKSDKPRDLYIQISSDHKTPRWITMGDFLEIVFYKEIESEEFIKECLAKLVENEKII